MKKTVGVVLVACLVGVVGYFTYESAAAKKPEAVVRTYIKAMMNRDFDTLAAINYRPQKQANIIDRAPEAEQAKLLQKMYEGYRKSFEAMKPIDNTTVTWSEKFFFAPGMDYEIIHVEKKTSPGTPSSDYRFRSVATVVIAASYPSPDIAPLYGGRRIKKANLQIDLIQSQDVVKGIQAKPVHEGWLFKWFLVDESSIIYWDS